MFGRQSLKIGMSPVYFSHTDALHTRSPLWAPRRPMTHTRRMRLSSAQHGPQPHHQPWCGTSRGHPGHRRCICRRCICSRVPSRILQLFAASCSVCQCNRVKSRPLSGEMGEAHRAVINERLNQSRHHLSVTTFTCQPPGVTAPASAACATSRLVIRAAQTLPADGHRSWLGVDARERHQKTKKSS